MAQDSRTAPNLCRAQIRAYTYWYCSFGGCSHTSRSKFRLHGRVGCHHQSAILESVRRFIDLAGAEPCWSRALLGPGQQVVRREG